MGAAQVGEGGEWVAGVAVGVAAPDSTAGTWSAKMRKTALQ
jgi:hypothetical protein